MRAEAPRLTSGPDGFAAERDAGGKRVAPAIQGEMIGLRSLVLAADPYRLSQAELQAMGVFDDSSRHGALSSGNDLGTLR